mmetsp:Transcript_14200/g.32276  ORF Transcript_14200/g.32276 Transcript_14200/m.32276 type:complete len:302 (+) Transcript_14200:965-1870(+)
MDLECAQPRGQEQDAKHGCNLEDMRSRLQCQLRPPSFHLWLHSPVVDIRVHHSDLVQRIHDEILKDQGNDALHSSTEWYFRPVPDRSRGIHRNCARRHTDCRQEHSEDSHKPQNGQHHVGHGSIRVVLGGIQHAFFRCNPAAHGGSCEHQDKLENKKARSDPHRSLHPNRGQAVLLWVALAKLNGSHARRQIQHTEHGGHIHDRGCALHDPHQALLPRSMVDGARNGQRSVDQKIDHGQHDDVLHGGAHRRQWVQARGCEMITNPRVLGHLRCGLHFKWVVLDLGLALDCFQVPLLALEQR